MKHISRKTKDIYEIKNIQTHQAAAAESPKEQKRPTKTCVNYRYFMTALAFLIQCIVNAQRVALSIAVVNMSNYTSPIQQNTSAASCPALNDSKQDSTKPTTGGDFDWDAEMQGYILGASFFGCGLFQVVMGLLVDAHGAKWIAFWANMICGLVMIISPILSWWHVYSLIAAHFVRSVAQSSISPAMCKVVSDWAPRGERALMYSIIITGNDSGSLLGAIVSGYLCELLGWQYVFYVSGGLGCLLSIQFGLSFYETPWDHPRISETELNYITEDQTIQKNKKKLPTPWLKIFTSIPTYALVYAQVGVSWAFYYFVTVHPAYMSTILHFPISENGLFLALPFVLRFGATILASSVSDFLYRKKIAGVDKIRKGCHLIASLGFSLSVLGIYFSGCNRLGNVLFLGCAVVFCGVFTSGSITAIVDMAPNFAGTLKGLTGTFLNITAFIIPVMVGYLTKDQIIENWHNVFLICISVVMSSGFVFAVFGSAEAQPWNFTEEKLDAAAKKSAAGGIAAEEHDNADITAEEDDIAAEEDEVPTAKIRNTGNGFSIIGQFRGRHRDNPEANA